MNSTCKYSEVHVVFLMSNIVYFCIHELWVFVNLKFELQMCMLVDT
jgi:hypothetical protein